MQLLPAVVLLPLLPAVVMWPWRWRRRPVGREAAVGLAEHAHHKEDDDDRREEREDVSKGAGPPLADELGRGIAEENGQLTVTVAGRRVALAAGRGRPYRAYKVEVGDAQRDRVVGIGGGRLEASTTEFELVHIMREDEL